MSPYPVAVRKLSVDEFVGPIPLGILDAPPRVRIASSTIRSIFRHVERNSFQEVGGLLVGQVNYEREIMDIEINGSIPGKAAISGFASLLFTLNTWKIFYRRKAKRYQDEIIIGWYHSHPGLGLFLSHTDQFTHRSFFNQPWHLALVLDPSNKTYAFFQTTFKDVIRLSNPAVIYEDRTDSKNGLL